MEDTDNKTDTSDKRDGETDKLVSKDEAKKVSFDDVLVDLGEFGKYQKLTYFLLFLPTIFSDGV